MSDFGKFLTGTVLAQAKLDKVVVTIADVRTTSYGREVIDFEQPVAEDYSSLPLNQTNALRLRRLFGRDRVTGGLISVLNWRATTCRTQKPAS